MRTIYNEYNAEAINLEYIDIMIDDIFKTLEAYNPREISHAIIMRATNKESEIVLRDAMRKKKEKNNHNEN